MKTQIGLYTNNVNINTDGVELVDKYLTFTALKDNCYIGFYKNPNSSVIPTIEYSFDKTNWSSLTENKVSIPQNTNMYCRGINPYGISNGYEENIFNYFIGEGKFNVSGDIMSLIDYNTMPDTMVGSFFYLFGWDNEEVMGNIVDIVDASKLVLSAKVLTSGCYAYMFSHCTNLINAPKLSATELAKDCYYSMFSYCASLTEVPELPSTQLAEYCYAYMFCYCTSLDKTPKLPSTQLEKGCYAYMFSNCNSLTETPELPATELTEDCYFCMFYNCTNLNKITCLATDISKKWCTYFLTYGTLNNGIFYKNCDMNSWSTGINGIPSGWSVQNVILT